MFIQPKAAKSSLFIFGLWAGAASSAIAGSWTLSGQDLTVDQVVEIARDDNAIITLSDSANAQIQDGFDLVMEAARQNKPVYGLTVGVGWNKDRPVVTMKDGEAVLADALLEQSRKFNLNSLRAHGAGVGEPMDIEIVRAGMAIRLNQVATGQAGVQPQVAEMYRRFLEENITPVVPSRGSVGEADITLASHIGIAMIGEGDVFKDGERLPASEALEKAGIEPLSPVGKDFLSILSTNALTAGHAALMTHDLHEYLQKEAVIFALTLEGFNGNVAPFIEATNEIRPFEDNLLGAAPIREALEGSYLWEPSDTRALQDPLSFRTMAYVLGNSMRAEQELRSALEIQINNGDDNPSVIVGASSEGASPQVDRYYVEGDISGAIFPTANFEMLPIATRVEAASISLVRLSQVITTQTIRFENPEKTRLSRFLSAPSNDGHAFGAIQKPLVSLLAENRQLGAHPAVGSVTMSGNIEDFNSNAPLAVSNLDRIIDNLYWMSSVQLLHGAQAADLRDTEKFGAKSGALLDAYRKHVPFVDKDRVFTEDFNAGYAFLNKYKIQ